MILPDEIATEHLVPVLRHLLVRHLLARGLSESRVGDLVGISQSAVSKYKAGKVRLHPLLRDDPRVQEVAREAAEGLARGRARLKVLSLLVGLTRELENRGPLCALHEEAVPWLQGLGCTLCVAPTENRVVAEQVVLAELRRALAALANVEGFPQLVPHVGSNLAYALEGADDLEGVAAVPGRIYQIRGQVKVPGPPEFGASRHVAEVVLALTAVDGRVRSAVNLAWSEPVLAACRALGWRTFEMDAAYEGRRAGILQGLGGEPAPEVLFHRGAFGIEPITYVVGRTPGEVVDRVRRLCQAVREGAVGSYI